MNIVEVESKKYGKFSKSSSSGPQSNCYSLFIHLYCKDGFLIPPSTKDKPEKYKAETEFNNNIFKRIGEAPLAFLNAATLPLATNALVPIPLKEPSSRLDFTREGLFSIG
jgi:hypothetical protein